MNTKGVKKAQPGTSPIFNFTHPPTEIFYDVPFYHPTYREEFLTYVHIEQILFGIDTQKKRISDDYINYTKDRALFYVDFEMLLGLYGRLYRALIYIKNIRRNDKSLQQIYKKHKRQLGKISSFRHDIEHFSDSRIEGLDGDGNPLRDISILGTIVGMDGRAIEKLEQLDELENLYYGFGGKKIKIVETINLVDEIREDIHKWNKEGSPS